MSLNSTRSTTLRKLVPTSLTDQPTVVQTIGDGSARIDLEAAIYVTSRLHASGAEDDMFWPMPYSCGSIS